MFWRETIVIAPQWRDLLQAHHLASMEQVYRYAAGTALKTSRSSEVRTLGLGVATGNSQDKKTLFLKKYWIDRRSQIWSGMFRGVVFGIPKARREYRNLCLLNSMQLGAPDAVAFGEERCGGVVRRSFIISEGVPDALPLHHAITRWLPKQSLAAQRSWKRELISKLALHTRRMHDGRFVHHDYFWRNIILCGVSLDRFALIDSHKGGLWLPGMGAAARAKDLGTLDSAAPAIFTAAERLRFYMAYAGRDRLTAADKRIIRRILRVAKPLRQRQTRRACEE